ncbi:phage/plasmid primase, P4 family [Cryobacterium sp. PH31-O1]|uniref:phage/plasmid primase, P4 family n=1 Tax=Cryobacterium sp. PH31-O1 TaxID=3046306 RepID=UPI0024B99D47|nr:phage/plasmid primase, P4 family [Cryobacterium sp. PH31-O1]MDJ0338251.1 phage/plasmid primase, P4 family [Cryobacterium sp. PH31-O1]
MQNPLNPNTIPATPAAAPTTNAVFAALDPAHQEYLRSRAVSPAVAEGRGYRSTTPAKEAREDNEESGLARLGWSSTQRAAWGIADKATDRLVRALVLPLYGPNDDDELNCQIRLDVPRTEAEVVEPLLEDATPAQVKKRAAELKKPPRKIKFELPAYFGKNAPRDEAGRALAAERSNQLHGIPADVNPLAAEWLLDTEIPQIWTEGIPKADSILSAAIREGVQFVPVAWTGVTMPFRAPNSHGNPTDDYALVGQTVDELSVEDHEVYLAWDADWRTNRAVRNALLTTAQLIVERQTNCDWARVMIIDVPATERDPKRGIDDYLADALAAGESQPLLALIDAALTLDEVLAETREFSNDDAGRGERLAAECVSKGDALFNVEAKSWMRWDGFVWVRDQNDAMTSRAKSLTERDKGDSERYNRSRGKVPLNSAVDMARTEPGMSVSENSFDADPWLLNVANGTVDLRTGELLEPDAANRQTLTTSVGYDPEATAPAWDKFISEIFLGDAETVAFAQRALGKGLVGKVLEEKIVILSGGGGNGKSVLVEAVTNVLGGYATTLVVDALIGGMADEHRATLKSRRFVVASETGVGAVLDEAAMKTLTSRDAISGRHLFQNRITFQPTHSVFLVTNHRPTVKAQDWGTWRRIALLPFDFQVQEGTADKDLPMRLAAEAAGILRWLVEGALAYAKDGIGTCSAVEAATSEYRNSSDDLGQFLEEVCRVGEGYSGVRSDIYRTYKAWVSDRGQRPWTQKAFVEALQERGVLSRHTPTKKGAGGNVSFVGLMLDPSSDAVTSLAARADSMGNYPRG